MNNDDLQSRVEELISKGESVLSTETKSSGRSFVDLVSFYEFRSASISFILKLFGSEHPYFIDFSVKVENAQPLSVKRGIGILRAVKGEIENGWLVTTKGLISADIFADFLEMSDHLIEEGYKDPAAVLIGCALEKHLHYLCEAHGVDTTFERNGNIVSKKADVINADLVKKVAYSKLDQKSVTYWLGLRNSAAHGKFDEYNSEQIVIMSSSVTEFITRTSK